MRFSASAPDGFIAFSHAGDDWRACRDHIRERLGIIRREIASPSPTGALRRPPSSQPEYYDHEGKTAPALALWHEGIDPRGTVVEIYLRSRGLDLADDIAGEVLRWNARIGAMVALFRNIATDEPQAVSRTFLDRDGRKIEPKFLGPVRGAAIKLDPDENVLAGLHIGEGVETCLAARQLGLRPTWALGSAGAVAAFPTLSGIESLSILAEHDEANKRALKRCSDHWRAAGREVRILRPIGGKDINDAIRGGRR